MFEQTIDEVIDAMLAKVAVAEQVLVTGQAGHSDSGGNSVVDCGQPPSPGAAHTHSGGADAGFVYFRSTAKIIERNLIVADEHPPERATQPEIDFEEALLFVSTGFGCTRWSGADAIAVPVRIGRQHDI